MGGFVDESKQLRRALGRRAASDAPGGLSHVSNRAVGRTELLPKKKTTRRLNVSWSRLGNRGGADLFSSLLTCRFGDGPHGVKQRWPLRGMLVCCRRQCQQIIEKRDIFQGADTPKNIEGRYAHLGTTVCKRLAHSFEHHSRWLRCCQESMQHAPCLICPARFSQFPPGIECIVNRGAVPMLYKQFRGLHVVHARQHNSLVQIWCRGFRVEWRPGRPRCCSCTFGWMACNPLGVVGRDERVNGSVGAGTVGGEDLWGCVFGFVNRSRRTYPFENRRHSRLRLLRTLNSADPSFPDVVEHNDCPLIDLEIQLWPGRRRSLGLGRLAVALDQKIEHAGSFFGERRGTTLTAIQQIQPTLPLVQQSALCCCRFHSSKGLLASGSLAPASRGRQSSFSMGHPRAPSL